MFLLIPYPNIDPVILEIGPLAIRWYSLAYVVGLLAGWRYCRWLARQSLGAITAEHVDDFLFWAVLGVVLGGRLGSVFFYNPGYYLENPLDALYIWRGGMSFHGGLLGVFAAMVLFARRHEIPLFHLTDIVAAAAPIGLFLGRLANFVNGELYGRPTDFGLAMVFPTDPLGLPRHPSQLYEAALEGLLLFFLLLAMVRLKCLARPGLVTGVFLSGYAVSRMAVELVREPDAHLGFLFAGVTMGQLLSLPMLLGGIGLIAWSTLRQGERGRP